MPEYLHPGVYIEEIERGPKPIEGVPTSTAAFIGEAERGPTRPRLVTSYKDYVRWFGTVFNDTKFLPYAVNGFFENGGKRMYVCMQPTGHDVWRFNVTLSGNKSGTGEVYRVIQGGIQLDEHNPCATIDLP